MKIFINEFCGHPFQMELSRHLASVGHEVRHVYFADNSSTPKGDTDRRSDDSARLTIEGVHIRRRFAKHSLLTRRQADLEYGEEVAKRVDQFVPEVVLSANMPLDAQRVLQRAAQRNGARFVFWVQDIYSVAARFVLRRKARFLERAGGFYFESLEKRLLRRSDAIVCIAPGFADLLRAWKIQDAKITVIGNWAPLDEMPLMPRVNPWGREHRVADKFCLMYSGTLGMKHRPELLLALAKHLESRGGAGRLIVIAGGAGADWLRQRAHEVSPEVLTLLPFQPYKRVPEVLASADVLITLLDAEAGPFAVPSKTLSYLCAGRAVLVAAPEANEVARVVRQADAGMVVSPSDPRAIIEAAEFLLFHPEVCARFGQNGRKYAEQSFSIEAIAERFLGVMRRPGEAELPSKPGLSDVRAG